MDGYASVRFQLLAVQCREDANQLLGSATHSAANNSVISIYHLNEVTSEHMDTLDSENLCIKNLVILRLIFCFVNWTSDRQAYLPHPWNEPLPT